MRGDEQAMKKEIPKLINTLETILANAEKATVSKFPQAS